jgi:hypothetical protein
MLSKMYKRRMRFLKESLQVCNMTRNVLEVKVKEFDAKEKEQQSTKSVEGKLIEEMVSKDVFDVTVSDCEMKLEFYRKQEKDLEEEIHVKILKLIELKNKMIQQS